MPGATETEFFEPADMLDTKIGQLEKDDPADVAKVRFEAMMRGERHAVAGWKNKIQITVANLLPAGMLAEQHRKQAEPGYGERRRSRTKCVQGHASRSSAASFSKLCSFGEPARRETSCRFEHL